MFSAQIVNEMAGEQRYSGACAWPGSSFHYGPDKLLPRHMIDYDEDLDFFNKVEVCLQWFVDEQAPANFVAMHFKQPDLAGHYFGPNSVEVRLD